jgi:hypothetical protein
MVVAPPPAVAPAPVIVPAAQPLPSMTPWTPFGNVMAPPVYSDPTSGPVPPTPLVASVPPPVAATPAPVMTPAAPLAATAPSLPPPPASTLPPPGVGTYPVVPAAGVSPMATEYLRVLPQSLVAPVGTEMLLKATVNFEGSMLPARPVNWNIGQGSAGAFTPMGVRDRAQWVSFWEAPQKIDDWSATSRTAFVPITLNTATPDPNDDIPICRGEAWVTMTSLCEGTSIVTACTPSIAQNNVATATIYWVDAQWIFPQTAPAEAGRPYTLTTTVMRRTDGAPLAGWIVRYDVAGGAGLGYEGGASTESTTDGAGRASVEVSPRDGGGGATQVFMTIIRPATGGPVPMPRLEVGRAASTIMWGATGVAVPAAPGVPGAPAMPAPSLPAGPATPAPPIPMPPPPLADTPPSLPAGPPAGPSPYSPPPASAPASPSPYTPAPAATGSPRLEVTLGAATPAQVAVGEFVSFALTVTNRGDGLARNIRIVDRFDRGLNHESAKPGEYSINYSGMRDLPPNESAQLPLTFRVVDGGVQCHDVTVTADGAAAVSQRGCVTARQSAIKVEVNVPRQQVVGEIAKCSAVVRNVGDTAATNLEFIARADVELSIRSAEPGHEVLQDGRIRLLIDRLEPGEKRTFGIEAVCRAPSNKACVTFIATANGGVVDGKEGCVEILAPLASGPGGAATPPAADGLRLTISTNTNPARVGQRMLVTVEVDNAGQQVERAVAVRVKQSAELTPDAAQIQAQGEGQVTIDDVRFTPLAELAPGQRKQYLIPYTPNRTGSVQLTAEVATGTTIRKSANSDTIEILGASP